MRPPTAQWTVTGAGALILAAAGDGPRVTMATTGTIVDAGITDTNNMGAAMAPAAYETLRAHFADTGRTPDDYDLIVTGDLGWEGSRILCDLMDTHSAGGVSLSVRDRHNDCGCMIFSRSTQDTHSGGSGCGCSAAVLASYLLPRIQSGHIRRMLYLATGALMSPDSLKQGRSIPGVAHLLCLETPESVVALCPSFT